MRAASGEVANLMNAFAASCSFDSVSTVATASTKFTLIEASQKLEPQGGPPTGAYSRALLVPRLTGAIAARTVTA